MRPAWWKHVVQDMNPQMEGFTTDLRQKLRAKPHAILKRKNPFLFRVRVVEDAREFVEMVINAYLSSSEETRFGGILEQAALSICHHAKGGRKSGIEKIDLEYDDDEGRTLIQIKSGINWGNSSQIQALDRGFRKAVKILRQGSPKLRVHCIEGICYGPSGIWPRDHYDRVVGHAFWKEISGWDGTARELLQLIGRHSSNGLHDERRQAYDRMLEFLREHGACDEAGKLRWDTVLDLVLQEKSQGRQPIELEFNESDLL